MSKVLGWIGKGLGTFVVALIALVAVVSLISGPQTGAKTGYAIVHWTLVSTGIVVSYADNAGPDLQSGMALGNAASGDTKPKK